GRGQLVAVALRLRGVDAEDVPVDRPRATQTHLDHEVDLVFGEPLEATVGDPFERGAFVLADDLGELQNLVGRRPARRNRVAVAIRVRVALCGRDTESTG